MPNEFSAGGIVFRPGTGTGAAVEFLVILDGYGRWTFPKGLVEPGESPEMAAVREVAEETGIEAEVVGDIGETRYTYHHPRKGRIHKTVTFYLLAARGGTLAPQAAEIAAAEWVAPAEAARRADYEGHAELVRRAEERIAALPR